MFRGELFHLFRVFFWLVTCGSYHWDIVPCYHQDSPLFSISESFLSLRWHISLIFNVCAWTKVEVYFHSSQMENDLPRDPSLTNPGFTSSICFCAPGELSLSSAFSLFCSLLLCQHHATALLWNLAWAGHISWCRCSALSFDNIGLLIMHFKISPCSPKPGQNWVLIALNL